MIEGLLLKALLLSRVPADLQQYLGLSELKKVNNIHVCFSHLGFVFFLFLFLAEEMMLEDFSYGTSEGSASLLSLTSPSFPPPLPLTDFL